jgi:hypothetical protein
MSATHDARTPRPNLTPTGTRQPSESSRCRSHIGYVRAVHLVPHSVILGGRALVGPIGRGVPREEPAVHFAGRHRLVGSPLSTSKDRRRLARLLASSRAVPDGRRGHRRLGQRALSLSTVGRRRLPRRLRSGLSAELHASAVGSPRRFIDRSGEFRLNSRQNHLAYRATLEPSG